MHVYSTYVDIAYSCAYPSINSLLAIAKALSRVEPCADVNFCRRRWLAVDPKKSAAAARRWWPKSFFQKIPEKISFYPQNSLMTFLIQRNLQQNKYTATMASAARRQIIGGRAAEPTNCRRAL